MCYFNKLKKIKKKVLTKSIKSDRMIKLSDEDKHFRKTANL